MVFFIGDPIGDPKWGHQWGHQCFFGGSPIGPMGSPIDLDFLKNGVTNQTHGVTNQDEFFKNGVTNQTSGVTNQDGFFEKWGHQSRWIFENGGHQENWIQ